MIPGNRSEGREGQQGRKLANQGDCWRVRDHSEGPLKEAEHLDSHSQLAEGYLGYYRFPSFAGLEGLKQKIEM